MITGDLWTRFEWGVWWTWEPRLTTYLILMLIVIAYFVLRNAIDEPERRGTIRGGRLASSQRVDVPICFMITRLDSLKHPPRGAARRRHERATWRMTRGRVP